MRTLLLASFFTLLLLTACRSQKFASEQSTSFSHDKVNLTLKLTDTILSISSVDPLDLPQSSNYLSTHFNLHQVPAKTLSLPPFAIRNKKSPAIIIRKITVEGQLSDSLSTAEQKESVRSSKKEPERFFTPVRIILTVAIAFMLILLLSKFFRSYK